ncbi:hypothetical protein QE152_g3825 [Popillia japonica]|uniref:Uncharacterized protein n=1 Tax=Popillia japonica TaxID=7064 RepID=A0AAW1N2L9_POPJA
MCSTRKYYFFVKTKLDRLDKGESAKNVARNLNIVITALKDWRKNRHTLQSATETVESEVGLEARKIIKKPKLDVLDQAITLIFLLIDKAIFLKNTAGMGLV